MDGEFVRLAHTIDYVCLGAAFILPIPAVLRWNLYGVALGTLVHWASLVVAGILISELDPNRLEGGTGMLDFVWLLAGWVAGLVYCVMIYGAKRLGQLAIRFGRMTKSRRPEVPTQSSC